MKKLEEIWKKKLNINKIMFNRLLFIRRREPKSISYGQVLSRMCLVKTLCPKKRPTALTK
jgi:hypothetical protein